MSTDSTQSEGPSLVRLRTGSATLVGQVRAGNEDSLLVSADLLAVADGMGGHQAGEVASAETVEVISQMAGHRSLLELVGAVHQANRRISSRAAEDPSLRGMGTTVCVVGLVDEDGEHLAVLNVGDSRVYLFAAGELHRLTEDHSLVESLVREGRITPEEAEVHPQRNVLTRALGVEALVVVDAWLLSPCDGDRFLLCSDGLFNEISEDRIAEILSEPDEPEVLARRLAAEADASGGRDNITVVVAEVTESGHLPAPLAERCRRIATPTVDLEDAFRDPLSDTATVPLVPISPARAAEDEDEDQGEAEDEVEDESEGDSDEGESGDAAGHSAVGHSADDRPADGHPEADSTQGDGTAVQPSQPEVTPDPQGEPSPDSDADADESEIELAKTVAAADAASVEGSHRSPWRTPVFLLVLLLIIVLSIGIVVMNQRQGYSVGVQPQAGSGTQIVVVYKGRATKFLWIDPVTQDVHNEIQVSKLPPSVQTRLLRGVQLSSEQDALAYVANLKAMTTTTTTTTTPTTTTTTTTTTIAPPVDPAAAPPVDPAAAAAAPPAPAPPA